MNRTTAIQAPALRAIPIPRAASHAALGRRRMLTRAAASERARVLAAFQAASVGVDERTAAARTIRYYRSRGADWARRLG